MTDHCECYLDDGEMGTDVTITCLKALRAWKCVECGGPIKPGEIYQLVKGKWSGEWDRLRTCPMCLRIQADLCPCAPTGTLWENLMVSLGLRLEDIPDTAREKIDTNRILAGGIRKNRWDPKHWSAMRENDDNEY